MSHNILEIQDGACLIGDAHYSSLRPQLYKLIQAIHSKKLLPTQLFLFGDIFDALFGSVSKSIQNNEEMISMINDISKEMDVVYLEGNHDFNIKTVFPQAKVYTIAEQPVEVSYKGKKVLIAHGDFSEDFGYKIYTKIIRSKYLLPMYNLINNLLRNVILNKLDTYLSKKEDCNKFKGFEEYVAKRLESKFECDYFIEGHFHQNKSIKLAKFTYINLAAFACNQRYFTVELNKENSFLQEKSFE